MAGFARYVDYFDRHTPFSLEQLERHLDAIGQRRNFRRVEDALAHEGFLRSLHRTLLSWGVGKRGSKLIDSEAFRSALRAEAGALSELQGAKLEEGQDVGRLGPKLWDVIGHIGIVENKNTVVAGTKCVHHLLTDLVPPMDRRYTQVFFGWANPEFQYHPRECFEHAFLVFARIAREVRPSKLVGEGWRTSGPKVIDNAIVGLCLAERLEQGRCVANGAGRSGVQGCSPMTHGTVALAACS